MDDFVTPLEAVGGGLSVIICSLRTFQAPGPLLQRYAEALEEEIPKDQLQFIYMVDTGSDLARQLVLLNRPDLTILELPAQFGEAGKIREALQHASFDKLLLLPPFMQIAPEALPKIVRRLDSSDVVIAERDRNDEAFLNRARGFAFRSIARTSGTDLRDPGCRARAFRREVLDTLPLLENQIKFLAIIAEHHGFRVESILVPQAREDRAYRSHEIRLYFDTVLDILSVAFLVRFLQKPFRLFGGLGLIITLCGVLVGAFLLIERTMGIGLSDRPMLLLSLLLIVLGIQVIAVGLIAEIVLFTRLPAQSTYHIRRIHERLRTAENPQPMSAVILDA